MYRKTSFRLWILTTLLAMITTIAISEKSDISKFETVHNSNAAILNRLGLVPLRIPDGHHKKRLAGPEPSSDVMSVESTVSQTRIHQPYSRRHGHRDSHVYIVKLPPSQPYYTLTKPHKSTSLSDHHDNDKVSTKTNKETTSVNSSPQVGFHSNGKPGKIYHWNLPMVKKMTEKKRLHAQMRIEEMRKKHVVNELNEQRIKSHVKHQQMADKTMNAILSVTGKTPLIADGTKESSNNKAFNGKRYHHLTSVNALNHNEKPVKHTRNNDKRLSYPRISDELRKAEIPKDNGKEVIKDNEKSNNKMYRLDNSYIHGLDSDYNNEQQHTNDRLAVWSLTNELHASSNVGNNSLRPKKHRKKAAMSYYAPINSRGKKINDGDGTTNIENNFPGNGKPKAFYVMEKSRQPIYYHPLLP